MFVIDSSQLRTNTRVTTNSPTPARNTCSTRVRIAPIGADVPHDARQLSHAFVELTSGEMIFFTRLRGLNQSRRGLNDTQFDNTTTINPNHTSQ
jgi:hypothetical protein